MDRNIYAPPKAPVDVSNRRYLSWGKGLLLVISAAWSILGGILVFFWVKEVLLPGHSITFSVTNATLIIGSILAIVGGILSGVPKRIGPPMVLCSFFSLTLNTQWGGINLNITEAIIFLFLGVSVVFIWYMNAKTRKQA